MTTEDFADRFIYPAFNEDEAVVGVDDIGSVRADAPLTLRIELDDGSLWELSVKQMSAEQ